MAASSTNTREYLLVYSSDYNLSDHTDIFWNLIVCSGSILGLLILVMHAIWGSANWAAAQNLSVPGDLDASANQALGAGQVLKEISLDKSLLIRILNLNDIDLGG